MADVIAAIQCMSLNERSSLSSEHWAELISGSKSYSGKWKTVFEEHAEFFRKSPDNEGYYALVWRRALAKRYFRPQAKILTLAEVEALSAEERKWVSRPPVPEHQIRTLVDIAIALHSEQQEASRDWRWWTPLVAGFSGSVIGAVLGAVLHAAK